MDGVHAVFESIIEWDAFAVRLKESAVTEQLPQVGWGGEGVTHGAAKREGRGGDGVELGVEGERKDRPVREQLPQVRVGRRRQKRRRGMERKGMCWEGEA